MQASIKENGGFVKKLPPGRTIVADGLDELGYEAPVSKKPNPARPLLEREVREIYMPARVLAACMPDWDSADDGDLSQAVGDALEHAWWHWRWLLAIREHKCRLVVVQLRDGQGHELYPHYQIGDMFTLSQWHPERAVADAQVLLASSGDGLSFDLPLEADLVAELEKLGAKLGVDSDEGVLDVVISAMLLLDEAHDKYVEELGDDFYIATRGIERDLDRLLDSPDGRWSNDTMQIIDTRATITMNQIYTENENGETPENVPVVYQPAGMGMTGMGSAAADPQDGEEGFDEDDKG
jgi:hypothetical protein